MVKAPTILLRAELVLSALAALSAVAFAFVAFQGQHYFTLAGEGLILVAGVFGILAGLGRFSAGPALAAACVGGAVFTGAYIGASETLVITDFRRFNANADRVDTAAALGRFALAALIGATGALMILSRKPGASIKRLVLGGVAFAPVAALVIAWRLGLIARAQDALPEAAFQVAALMGGLAAIVFVSIAAHCVIRAFEIGVDAAEHASENTPAQAP